MNESSSFDREIEAALALIVAAIGKLDAIGAPADIAAHLDFARHRAIEELGARASGGGHLEQS